MAVRYDGAVILKMVKIRRATQGNSPGKLADAKERRKRLIQETIHMSIVADGRRTADNQTSAQGAIASGANDPRNAASPQSEDTVNLSLVAIEKEGLVKLAASGSITAGNFDPSGKNPLERILGQNWASFRVILDMKQTTYIDSSAIGWLIGSHKSFKQQGGSMVLHDVPVSIRQMLDLLHVGKVVPIASNAQAAREIATANAGGQNG
jgi:anti-anti-sigma factor